MTWDLREVTPDKHASRASRQEGNKYGKIDVSRRRVPVALRHALALEIFNIWVWAWVDLAVEPGQGLGIRLGTETVTWSEFWTRVQGANANADCGYAVTHQSHTQSSRLSLPYLPICTRSMRMWRRDVQARRDKHCGRFYACAWLLGSLAARPTYLS